MHHETTPAAYQFDHSTAVFWIRILHRPCNLLLVSSTSPSYSMNMCSPSTNTYLGVYQVTTYNTNALSARNVHGYPQIHDNRNVCLAGERERRLDRLCLARWFTLCVPCMWWCGALVKTCTASGAVVPAVQPCETYKHTCSTSSWCSVLDVSGTRSVIWCRFGRWGYGYGHVTCMHLGTEIFYILLEL